jgi:hypothetical protein
VFVAWSYSISEELIWGLGSLITLLFSYKTVWVSTLSHEALGWLLNLVLWPVVVWWIKWARWVLSIIHIVVKGLYFTAQTSIPGLVTIFELRHAWIGQEFLPTYPLLAYYQGFVLAPHGFVLTFQLVRN